jgi:hypothetical protein
MSEYYFTLISNASMDYFPQNNPNSFTNKLSHRIELDTLRSKYEVGLNDICFPFPIQQNNICSLYVMCDLCEDQFVGSYKIPLLRNVHFDKDQKYGGAYVSREFDNVYYIPVKKSFFDSIEIQILDESGKKINFTSGKVTARIYVRKHRGAIGRI